MGARYKQNAINTHDGLSLILYDLFTHMVKYNDSIWKLLTFDNIEIVDHTDDEDYNSNLHHELDIVGDNLDRQQKVALLFKDGDDANNYRIQFQKLTDDAELEQQARLHMYIESMIPVNEYVSIVNIGFNIISHNKYNMIDGGKRSRIECLTEELIKFFNGLILDSATGEVFFNYKKSSNNDKLDSRLTNAKNFMGNSLTMSVLFTKLENSDVRNY